MSRPTFEAFKNKALKDPEVKAEYERLGPAFELRRQMIAARLGAGLTQQQMANALNTQKSNISRLENVNSTSSPTLSTIERYAQAAGYRVKIRLIPEE